MCIYIYIYLYLPPEKGHFWNRTCWTRKQQLRKGQVCNRADLKSTLLKRKIWKQTIPNIKKLKKDKSERISTLKRTHWKRTIMKRTIMKRTILKRTILKKTILKRKCQNNDHFEKKQSENVFSEKEPFEKVIFEEDWIENWHFWKGEIWTG